MGETDLPKSETEYWSIPLPADTWLTVPHQHCSRKEALLLFYSQWVNDSLGGCAPCPHPYLHLSTGSDPVLDLGLAASPKAGFLEIRGGDHRALVVFELTCALVFGKSLPDRQRWRGGSFGRAGSKHCCISVPSNSVTISPTARSPFARMLPPTQAASQGQWRWPCG